MPQTPSVPWPAPTGISATYPMQCHCAAIQWTITLDPPLLESESQGKGVYVASECDCTHCERKGIIACHPKMEDVKFTQGIEHRGSYLHAGKKDAMAPHWFCRVCGSAIGTDLTWAMENVFHLEPRATINLRMLRDIRPGELKKKHDGFMRTQ